MLLQLSVLFVNDNVAIGFYRHLNLPIFFPRWGFEPLRSAQALLRGPLAGPDLKSTYSSAPFDSRVVFHLRLIPSSLPSPLHGIIALIIVTAQRFAPPCNCGSAPRRPVCSFLPSRAEIRTRRGGTGTASLKHSENAGKIQKRFKNVSFKIVRVALIRI